MVHENLDAKQNLNFIFFRITVENKGIFLSQCTLLIGCT